ncbi:MAG: GatB/YqeY domain-containing protein [Nitrospirae bacterium]|nr:GatB/YqeY domain-containing protein [Nitrospirota bacterium]
MSLSEKLSEDLKTALKAGDKDTVSVIRMVRALIKNREIDKKAPLGDEEIYTVLNSMIRQRKDSIEQFSKGGREDLVRQETKELAIIQSYLPPWISEDELKVMISDVVAEAGAAGIRDMGRVMKLITPKVKGQVDGRLLSELVKQALER